MQTAKFSKNDSGFTCARCGTKVKPLGYTSRDHCPACLYSLHVDINPGDRLNTCEGLLVPVGVHTDSKKGYVIEYECSKCRKKHNNKAAKDDNFEVLLNLSKLKK